MEDMGMTNEQYKGMLIDQLEDCYGEVNSMKELFRKKYREYMKKVSPSTWRMIEKSAKDFNQTIEEVIFNNCITVYRDEIKDYRITHEPTSKGYVKEISSRKSGVQTRYKLTKKGIKWLSQ